MNPGEFAVVLTTIPVDFDADGLAETLIRERLAACVNVLPPMQSIYRWKGAVEKAAERQLVIKTTAAKASALQERLRKLHPYEVPEFLVIPVSGGSDGYLAWIRENCEGG